jgi:NADH-quinone oxidoreductase subunit M
MLGTLTVNATKFDDIDFTEKLVLGIICVLILVIGVYPKPFLHLSEAAVTSLVEQVNQKILFK